MDKKNTFIPQPAHLQCVVDLLDQRGIALLSSPIRCRNYLFDYLGATSPEYARILAVGLRLQIPQQLVLEYIQAWTKPVKEETAKPADPEAQLSRTLWQAILEAYFNHEGREKGGKAPVSAPPAAPTAAPPRPREAPPSAQLAPQPKPEAKRPAPVQSFQTFQKPPLVTQAPTGKAQHLLQRLDGVLAQPEGNRSPHTVASIVNGLLHPKGRVGRKEYLVSLLFLVTWMMLSVLGLLVFHSLFSHNIGDEPSPFILFLMSVFFILGLTSFFFLTVKRLHDLRLRGLWSVVLFVPYLNLVLVGLLVLVKGTSGPNPYGLDPTLRPLGSLIEKQK